MAKKKNKLPASSKLVVEVAKTTDLALLEAIVPHIKLARLDDLLQEDDGRLASRTKERFSNIGCQAQVTGDGVVIETDSHAFYGTLNDFIIARTRFNLARRSVQAT